MKRQEDLHSEASYKRLEQGSFAWPPVIDDSMVLSQGQLTMLLEGIDWRRTVVAPQPQRPAIV